MKKIMLKFYQTIKVVLIRFWCSFLKLLPIIMSFAILLLLAWSLHYELIDDEQFGKRLENARKDILSVSGVLAGIIIAYSTTKVLQFRQEKINHFPRFSSLTQNYINVEEF